jgi:hypothetical protein
VTGTEAHRFFGTLFHVPDSHTFWRNRASGAEEGQLDVYEYVAAAGLPGAVFSGEDRIQMSGPADMEGAGLPSLRDQSRAKFGEVQCRTSIRSAPLVPATRFKEWDRLPIRRRSSGVNGGSGTTITEDSLTIVLDINSSGGGSTNSSTPNSTSGAPASGASNSGSDLFANLLNQIQTALQDVLQAFEGQATGASTASGGTGTAGTSTAGTSTTSTGTASTGSTSGSGSSNTTGGTNQTGSDSNTPATSGTTSDITIAAITIDSIEVTTGGTTSGTTTGTGTNATPGTNANTNVLQLLEQIFSALGSVFQQNGIGSSQTSSAAESPLATFLGQNGLTPGQFSQGVFASLQQNGGTGFSLADIFQSASSGQNLNLLA